MKDQPILVVGATGKTGSRVAARLRDLGAPVKPASRSSETYFDWTDPDSPGEDTEMPRGRNCSCSQSEATCAGAWETPSSSATAPKRLRCQWPCRVCQFRRTGGRVAALRHT